MQHERSTPHDAALIGSSDLYWKNCSALTAMTGSDSCRRNEEGSHRYEGMRGDETGRDAAETAPGMIPDRKKRTGAVSSCRFLMNIIIMVV